ncbi:hypothetical protein [Niallia sp. NCCP-28]|uniref:hypothetical protein n=1 Tax=Niallia sp. NCCP-28 TaxID=2934712 RepID=UPI00208B25EF|nr:hypothetical protein [Niallia sp. NCCP-28]GKU82209.1 hypothetical protein NCCP28_16050 [Niallia sp. NCCP-28]
MSIPLIEKQRLINTQYVADQKMLRKEFCKLTRIKVEKHCINGSDLAEWIIKNQSPDQLRELVAMIHLINKRKAPLRPFSETIATGLLCCK